jgi:RimJ/RimL family protein N-acetyltransferase
MLETDRLLLRKFTLDDVPDFFALNADPEVLEYVGRKPLVSLDQARERLLSAPLNDYATRGYGRLACIEKQSGRLIGFAGLKYVAELAETDLGFRFLPPYWGRGYATEAAVALLAYGRASLGIERIVGIVEPANLRSVNVFRKLGMNVEKQVSLSFTDRDLDLYA